jgi:hypothetical protein
VPARPVHTMRLLPGPHISQDLSVANPSASVVEQWRSKHVVNVVRDRLRRVLLSINTLTASVLRTLHHRIDHAADVQARYLDLTLTSSELLVGCGKATMRYPLCDLAAYVEDAVDGNSSHLLIDGPGVAVRRPLQHQLDSRAGARAWRFAQAVNYVASDRGSIRAASAWVDAHGINWYQRRSPLLPLRWWRKRRIR